MFIGKYSITIKENGKITPPAAFKEKYENAKECFVFENDEPDEMGTVLTYRFKNSRNPWEKLIANYKISDDKNLLIPIKYRAELMCECYIVGVGDGFQIIRAENYEKKVSNADYVEIESLLTELGF